MDAVPLRPLGERRRAELQSVLTTRVGAWLRRWAVAPSAVSLRLLPWQPECRDTPIAGSKLELEFVPDRANVELKSLKLYAWSFRERGAFHEAITNEIADDLAAAMQPRYLRLTAKFNVRGGIYTTVVATRRKPGWNPEPTVTLP